MCVPLELQVAWALELKISYHLAKISKPMTILEERYLEICPCFNNWASNLEVKKFKVLDISPCFNLLLDRSWIHSIEAVPSSLYQKFHCQMSLSYSWG